ncbi:hypothetical protein DFS34DRAFT_413847 [Phlyctochytrium arcticum]|nr:hypothetical protein DFS34DRAFT_413847 [Phlyctochytrium arcticum]
MYGDEREADWPQRDAKAMTNRWNYIRPRVNKFVGCVETATKKLGSGKLIDDILPEALKGYQLKHKSAFTLTHCWKVLVKCPRFMATFEKSSSTDPNEFEAKEDQPQGAKAAKRDRRAAALEVEDEEHRQARRARMEAQTNMYKAMVAKTESKGYDEKLARLAQAAKDHAELFGKDDDRTRVAQQRYLDFYNAEHTLQTV